MDQGNGRSFSVQSNGSALQAYLHDSAGLLDIRIATYVTKIDATKTKHAKEKTSRNMRFGSASSISSCGG